MAEHKRIIEARAASVYDVDFAEWVAWQVELLESRRFSELDIDHLIEEVSALSKRDYRKLESALRVILLHMLKWDFQPELRSESWRRSIHVQRNHVNGILSDSPSLKARIPEALASAYSDARTRAAFETTVFLSNFPGELPYTFDEIMQRKHDFAPDI